MISRARLAAAFALVLAMFAQAALASERKPVAVFNFELIDMSLQGEVMGSRL